MKSFLSNANTFHLRFSLSLSLSLSPSTFTIHSMSIVSLKNFPFVPFILSFSSFHFLRLNLFPLDKASHFDLPLLLFYFFFITFYYRNSYPLTSYPYTHGLLSKDLNHSIEFSREYLKLHLNRMKIYSFALQLVLVKQMLHYLP